GNDATNTLQVDEVAGSAANVGVQQTLASGATVTIDVNGAIAYDPNGAFEGLQTGQTATDTVTYRVKDPAGATSNTATVTITINGVNDAPQAVARRFNAVRQTALEVEPGATAISAPRVRVAGSLLTGATDVDDPAANADLVDETISTPHGTVDLDPDGSFVYTSAAGDSATTDTFSFKIKDTHNAQSTQTVTIDLQGGVYYVDNDNNGAADGTSTKPFKTVQLATAAAGTGDTIHVGASAGTTTSAATLKNNQVIVGAGKALTANLTGGGENTGATTLVAAGTAPTLGTTSGAVLTLASGNTVDSVDIDPDTTAKGIVAASAGAVTLKDVTVVDAGTASTGAAIDLTGANASASLQNVDITTQSATGLKLTNSAISADTASTIAATGGPAVDSSGATGGTLSFGTVSSTNSSGTGISLGGAAAFSATGGSLTGSAGIGFDLNGGAASVSYPGAISPAPGAGVVRVQNRTGATATPLRQPDVHRQLASDHRLRQHGRHDGVQRLDQGADQRDRQCRQPDEQHRGDRAVPGRRPRRLVVER
ncbi:MAG: Ig-like domain-containing protein, partial [Patulibacter minatonensis]